MIPLWILNKARRLTYSNTDQYDNIVWLEDLNEVYQDIVTTVTQEVNEDYFYDIFTSDLVANQNEYSFRTPTSWDVWMNKLKELYIKYTADWDYKRAKNISEATMEMTPDWYETNQSPENPIFIIADNSVFIYPKPSINVTWGIRASVTTIPRDLLIDDEESAIKLQRQHHKVLVYGVIPYIYTQRWMLNEAWVSMQMYEQLKTDLIMKLSDRDLSPLETSLPSLSYYE